MYYVDYDEYLIKKVLKEQFDFSQEDINRLNRECWKELERQNWDGTKEYYPVTEAYRQHIRPPVVIA